MKLTKMLVKFALFGIVKILINII